MGTRTFSLFIFSMLITVFTARGMHEQRSKLKEHLAIMQVYLKKNLYYEEKGKKKQLFINPQAGSAYEFMQMKPTGESAALCWSLLYEGRWEYIEFLQQLAEHQSVLIQPNHGFAKIYGDVKKAAINDFFATCKDFQALMREHKDILLPLVSYTGDGAPLNALFTTEITSSDIAHKIWYDLAAVAKFSSLPKDETIMKRLKQIISDLRLLESSISARSSWRK